MEITLFASDDSPQGFRRTVEWEELLEFFHNPREETVPKKELRMWSPATFRDDYRSNENVERVSAMVFDVDVDPIPSVETMQENLKGCQWFAHTSSSSTVLVPRWRLVLGVGRPIEAPEYDTMWAKTEFLLKSRGIPVGQQSKNSSRSWYEPRKGADGSYRIVHAS